MKNKKTSGTLRRVLNYVVLNHKKMFVLVLFTVLISVAGGLAGNIFMQVIIDNYIIKMIQTGDNLFHGLALVVCIMAIVYLISSVGTLLYTRYMAIIGQSVLKEIRDDLFQSMQKLPVKFFDTHSHGDVMSVYTNDTDTLRQFISQSLPSIFSSSITFIMSFILMIYYNIWLTGIVVILNTVLVFLSKKLIVLSRKYFIQQQDSIGKINGYIEEMLSGQKVIKVFCREERAKKDFYVLSEELYGYSSKAGGSAIVMFPIMTGFGNIQYIILAMVGGIMALYGHEAFAVSLGILISFLGISKQFTASIAQTAQQVNSIVLGMAGAERIFKLLDEPEEADEGYVTLVHAKETNDTLMECKSGEGFWAWKHPHHDGTITYHKVEGNVVFDHVDFSYDGKKVILHDISLYAKPNQKIAFVGATGAGKTTITNLINRFYDLTDGKIRYDGININKIKKSDLRKSMSVILQEVNLFSGSIMNNIRYGKLDAADFDCIEAAKLVGADDFISRLPNGYDTVLDEDGGSLSQGQRQLISIARAAVANPPVMIMDEATSSIDTRTEAIVQQGMDRLMHGRTVFVIAHRLSTVQNSDAIMVLEHGRIIERGSHEQLISQKGEYYQLYTGAFVLE